MIGFDRGDVFPQCFLIDATPTGQGCAMAVNPGAGGVCTVEYRTRSAVSGGQVAPDQLSRRCAVDMRGIVHGRWQVVAVGAFDDLVPVARTKVLLVRPDRYQAGVAVSIGVKRRGFVVLDTKAAVEVHC